MKKKKEKKKKTKKRINQNLVQINPTKKVEILHQLNQPEIKVVINHPP